ncbi:hypothetical protein L9F63_018901, partial [Diploptera punctata]
GISFSATKRCLLIHRKGSNTLNNNTPEGQNFEIENTETTEGEKEEDTNEENWTLDSLTGTGSRDEELQAAEKRAWL